MRDPPRWPRAFNLNHTAKLIGITRMPKREVTGRRIGEQGRQYDEEGISSRRGVAEVVRIGVLTVRKSNTWG